MCPTTNLNYLKCLGHYSVLTLLVCFFADLSLNIYLDHFVSSRRKCLIGWVKLNNGKLNWQTISFYQYLNLNTVYYKYKKVKTNVD